MPPDACNPARSATGNAADGQRDQPSASYQGNGAGLSGLAVRLSELARSLQSRRDPRDTMNGIARAAVGTVPGAEHAGLSLIEGRRVVRTEAATGEVVYRVDEAQYELGEGPCLDALYEQRTVRVQDTQAGDHWSRFARRAAELGVRSLLSFQLYVIGETLGALNLYASRPGAFTDESEDAGLLFAAHAAVAMADARTISQLSQALGVRDIIGQAKGILMERHKLTGNQAFTLLVRASQHTNTPLIEIARHLAESGELLTGR